MDIKWNNLEAVLNEFADAFIDKARSNLANNNSNASYELSNSLEKIVEIGEDCFSVKISLADYWTYLEHGRGPGKFPPPPAIRNWIEIKPVQAYPDNNGRIPTVEQLTFLISRKIAEEGTEPHPFFEPAKEEVINAFADRIDEAIEADVLAFIQEKVGEMMETYLGKK